MAHDNRQDDWQHWNCKPIISRLNLSNVSFNSMNLSVSPRRKFTSYREIVAQKLKFLRNWNYLIYASEWGLHCCKTILANYVMQNCHWIFHDFHVPGISSCIGRQENQRVSFKKSRVQWRGTSKIREHPLFSPPGWSTHVICSGSESFNIYLISESQ